ncbi:MAG TPA: hypothetical protein VGN72_12105 [Tepidisphaeraceae bacterium]|jgi:gas vesicle protein|nr:hypothetical protein [Tepidisphaeraceae bacterium]
MKNPMITTAVALAVSSMAFAPTFAADANDTAAQRTSDNARTTANEAGNSAENAAERAGNNMENAAERAGNNIENAAERTGDRIQNTADRAGEGMNNGVNNPDPALNTETTVNTTPNPNANTNANLGTGNTAMAPDAEDIKGVIADATEAFVKQGTFDDLVERLVDADRNRIGRDGYAEQDHADLQQASEAFLATWKEKYNTDFDIEDQKMVFNDQQFRVLQSEIGENAQTAGGAIDVDANANNDRATVNVDNNTGVDAPGNKAADTNRNDPGRNIATVTVNNKMGNLQVPMIHEMPDAWKIDVPDSVDGPKLKQNIIAHLNAAVAMKDQWPADANQAYANLSTHMLQALMDKPAETK